MNRYWILKNPDAVATPLSPLVDNRTQAIEYYIVDDASKSWICGPYKSVDNAWRAGEKIASTDPYLCRALLRAHPIKVGEHDQVLWGYNFFMR